MALENRSEMDHAALEAQELWLACSALQSAIETDGGDGAEVGTCYMSYHNICRSIKTYTLCKSI